MFFYSNKLKKKLFRSTQRYNAREKASERVAGESADKDREGEKVLSFLPERDRRDSGVHIASTKRRVPIE